MPLLFKKEMSEVKHPAAAIPLQVGPDLGAGDPEILWTWPGSSPNSFLDQRALWGLQGVQALIFLMTDPEAKDTLLALASLPLCFRPLWGSGRGAWI